MDENKVPISLELQEMGVVDASKAYKGLMKLLEEKIKIQEEKEKLQDEKEKLQAEVRSLNHRLDMYMEEQKLITCFLNKAEIEYMRVSSLDTMKCNGLYCIARYPDGTIELKRNEPFYVEDANE